MQLGDNMPCNVCKMYSVRMIGLSSVGRNHFQRLKKLREIKLQCIDERNNECKAYGKLIHSFNLHSFEDVFQVQRILAEV